MKFDKVQEVDMVCYELKLADYPRGKNRALINNLANGTPPYSEQEAQEAEIKINVNDLSLTRKAHDARTQLYNAFLKPGNYFTARSDMGAQHKRSKRSVTFTKGINKIMKRSIPYFECHRSKIALDVLHGIGPGHWDNRNSWCPDPLGIEDVLLPDDTLLTMKNLPFAVFYRSYTGPELIRLTRGPKVDPAWNMPMVNSALEWIDSQTTVLMGNHWPAVWSPEKSAERIKTDGGLYASGAAPTLDCFDMYFWSEDAKQSGWRRRIIVDSWSTPVATTGGRYTMTRRTGDLFKRDEFLYNPGKRKFADRLSEFVSFQFADLSAVAPFRYHSVRSLGFLLYAVCHLQNRMRCRFNESVFEALLQYFRVSSLDDAERAVKIELANRGIIDNSVKFVSAEERWQVNSELVQLGLRENQSLIEENSALYTQNQNYSRDKTEKTKFQVMAELQAMTTMTSAAFNQAYVYQNGEYREIIRRFCNPHSTDPDVQEFRALMLRSDVPERMLVAEAWECEPERVMGAGNKTLELAVAQQLMEFRNLYDPESQRKILRDFTLATTDDPARTEDYVPEEPHVSDSVHDTELVFGAIMQGSFVTPKPGLNNVEVIETMIKQMGMTIRSLVQGGNTARPEQIQGLQMAARYTQGFIQLLAEDKNEKKKVSAYEKTITRLMNFVKGFAQRLAQAAKEQQAGNGGMEPKDKAKLALTVAQGQQKIKQMKESHAERTAQRQLQFEQETQQREQESAQKLRHSAYDKLMERQ